MKNISTSLFRLTVCAFGLLYAPMAQAQCGAGEHSVSLIVNTDDYGYEGYWELTPGTNACGLGTIASGGNTNVGCTAGSQNQTQAGYGNNLSITEGPWCLTENAFYTIHYRDDWGDGGFHFRILIDGMIAHEFYDAGLGTDFTFQVVLPPLHDVACMTFRNKTLVQGRYMQQNANALKVLVFNYGAETVNSVNLSYSIDGGTAVSAQIAGLSIAPYQGQVVSHPISWTPTADGLYNIQFRIDSVNGAIDEVSNNNSEIAEYEIGPGRLSILDSYLNGTPTSSLIASNSIALPTDLDFHPTLSRKQLWIINKGTENSGGTTVTINQTGEPNQTSELLQDGNAWHFMSLPTAIAFGANGNFGTAPGVFDANHTGTANAFTGPTLWSSDPDVYAQPSGGNGSHIDMLHESPNSQGMAWERDNVYWLFDGYNNDIVRYDFVNDHNPGNSDHSDAIVRRYSDVSVLKDANGTVSHLELDEEKQWLYVVDNGHQRIFRMNIETGSPSLTPPAYGPHEAMAEYESITGYDWENVVTTGLSDPAGIAIQGNRMVVSDHQTGEIILYDISVIPALELRRIATNAQGIMGICIGPDGKIYYVETTGNKVQRLDPDATPLAMNKVEEATLSIYPNPSNGSIRIQAGANGQHLTVEVYSLPGQLIQRFQTNSGQFNDLQLTNGTYLLRVLDQSGKELGKKRAIICR
jgi:hypothetical protein